MAYHFSLCDLSTKRILNVDEKGHFLNKDALYQEKALLPLLDKYLQAFLNGSYLIETFVLKEENKKWQINE